MKLYRDMPPADPYFGPEEPTVWDKLAIALVTMAITATCLIALIASAAILLEVGV